MWTQRSPLGSVTCLDEGTEVTKEKWIARFQHSRQQGVQALVESVPRIVEICPWKTKVLMMVTNLVLQRGRRRVIRRSLMSHNVVSEGKGDASVTSLCLWAATVEEGVAGTHLLQLTLPK
nr:unnamed protein product [Spirometra erinaceieuropaei]